MSEKTRTLLAKDTVIRTNIGAMMAFVMAIVTAFVSWTIATTNISMNRSDINKLDQRVIELERSNVESQKLLVEIATDVRAIKERQD